ncbi:hypothetical protein F5X97DRAFT_324322 [Nemania serpens]|nr:hypothetical protein F5X97DRAFT_324322 [Nemania serpens]
MMISQRGTTGTLLLVFANVLMPLGTIVFTSSLFRSRPLLEATNFSNPPLETRVHKPPFDKVVFMMTLERLDIFINSAALTKLNFEINKNTHHEQTVQVNYLIISASPRPSSPGLQGKELHRTPRSHRDGQL